MTSTKVVPDTAVNWPSVSNESVAPFVRRMLSQSVSVGLPAANLTHAVTT